MKGAPLMLLKLKIINEIENNLGIDMQEKIKVAERLANLALAEKYGVKGLNYKNPMYKTHTIEKGKIREEIISVEQLQYINRIYIINSVQKWREAFLIFN